LLGVVAADNVRSCRVLEKTGFVRVGEETKQIDGSPRAILIYRFEMNTCPK